MSSDTINNLTKETHLQLWPLYDANVFCGHYPFRKTRCAIPGSLHPFLLQENIRRCVATPFESLFYRQPWEGLQPWLDAEESRHGSNEPGGVDGNTLFWLVVNPLMPKWADDVRRAAKHPLIAGLRLWPRYHGYGLEHVALREVAGAAAEFSLPLNLSARLLDDRLHPPALRSDPPFTAAAVNQLLESCGSTRWLLSMFHLSELKQCAAAIAAQGDLFVDIGCSKPFEVWEDDIRATAPLNRIVVGTGAPLYYHAGTRISLQRTGFTEEEKKAMFETNLSVLTGQPREFPG